MCAKLLQSCLTLCDPTDCNPAWLLGPWNSPGHNTGGLPFPSPGDLPDSGTESWSRALADGFFTAETLGKLNQVPAGGPLGSSQSLAMTINAGGSRTILGSHCTQQSGSRATCLKRETAASEGTFAQAAWMVLQRGQLPFPGVEEAVRK